MDAIAFFCDRIMLPGLHVAIKSYLDSNSHTSRDTYVFCDRLTAIAKKDLERTWRGSDASAKLTLIDFVPERPEGAPALLGNSTAFGRLHLGHLLPEYRRCLYLDCDLVVNDSVEEIFSLLDGECTLAVDGSDTCEETIDRDLYAAAGYGARQRCFNSGVLGIDLDRWRSTNALSRCLSVAGEFPGMSKSADQGLMNVALNGEYRCFNERFNTKVQPHIPIGNEFGTGIYHFVGSPKPWDPWSGSLHRMRTPWLKLFRKTAIGNNPLWRYSSAGRMWNTAMLAYRQKRLQAALESRSQPKD